MLRIAETVMLNPNMSFTIVRENGGTDYRCCPVMSRHDFIRKYKGTDVWSDFYMLKHIRTDLDNKVITFVV